MKGGLALAVAALALAALGCSGGSGGLLTLVSDPYPAEVLTPPLSGAILAPLRGRSIERWGGRSPGNGYTGWGLGEHEPVEPSYETLSGGRFVIRIEDERGLGGADVLLTFRPAADAYELESASLRYWSDAYPYPWAEITSGTLAWEGGSGGLQAAFRLTAENPEENIHAPIEVEGQVLIDDPGTPAGEWPRLAWRKLFGGLKAGK